MRAQCDDDGRRAAPLEGDALVAALHGAAPRAGETIIELAVGDDGEHSDWEEPADSDDDDDDRAAAGAAAAASELDDDPDQVRTE